jgi:hypothetical protein
VSEVGLGSKSGTKFGAMKDDDPDEGALKRLLDETRGIWLNEMLCRLAISARSARSKTGRCGTT